MDKVTLDTRQILGLREQGLNDKQICAVLECGEEELVKAVTAGTISGEIKSPFGAVMEFSQEQIELAKGVILGEAVSGDSSSARLRAAALILQLHSIPASDKYRAAKGLNSTQTVNNIMIAVNDAQKLKHATITQDKD